MIPCKRPKKRSKDVAEEKADKQEPEQEPEYGPKVQKRIQKLVSQRREAEIQAKNIQEQKCTAPETPGTLGAGISKIC